MPMKTAAKKKATATKVARRALPLKRDVPGKTSAREKLLDAALKVIREKGYAATSVDDLCHAAGVTKGAFFHHFASKEDLAVAAASYWSEVTGAFFRGAPYHAHKDPLDRVLGYIDFRREILQGDVADFTCLLGTMVQETYESSPRIRQACDASISSHAAVVAEDIAAAKKLYAPDAGWNAQDLGLFTQAVMQGAFILAKARHRPDEAEASILHLRRYIECLFNRKTER